MKTFLSPTAATFLSPLLAIACLFPLPHQASAQPAVMIEAGNERLRDDLQWLIDRGVINFSVTAWPVSLSALDEALYERRKTDLSEADLSALRGVQTALAPLRKRANYGVGLLINSEPFMPTGFEAQARGRIEANAFVEGNSDDFAGKLQVNGIYDPLSERQTKADLQGSYISGRFGGQVLYAGQLQHWWGPGQDGSLIWSNASTAIPGVGLQRGSQHRFETPWLSWIGPWTYDLFVGRMQHNQFVPGTRIFSMRLSARPLRGLEIGASRLIQWGGQGADNSLSAWGDAFLGRANDPTRAPNNELAGFDARYTFNVGGNPLTLYGQLLGEDEAGKMPAKHILQLGTQFKHAWAGYRFQWYAEASDTMTSRYFGSNTDGANIAYRHGFYRDGLYEQGLPIGFFAGGDAKVYSADLSLIPQDNPHGLRYGIRLAQMDLNPSSQKVNQAYPLADRRQVAELSVSWMLSGTAMLRAALVGQHSRVNGNDVGIMFSANFQFGR